MAREEMKMVREDQTVAYGLAWIIDKPIANVVIATGMEEHSGRYDDFAKFLNKNGYNVYCLDFYGQGQNVTKGGEKLGCVPRSAFRKYVTTLYEMILKIKVSTLPVYLFGHSMGSFHVQDYIQRYGAHIDKAVLSGTNGKDILSKMGFWISKLVVTKKNYNNPSKFLASLAIGAYQKSVKDRKYDSDWISHDEEIVRKYEEDQLSGKGSSNGFYFEMLKGINRLPKKQFILKIPHRLPILLIAGDQDPVGHYGKGVLKLEKAYRKVGLIDVQTIIYEGKRHEVLNEFGRDKVYDDVLAFLKK